MLVLLRGPNGATIATVMRSTGWQPHGVARGSFGPFNIDCFFDRIMWEVMGTSSMGCLDHPGNGPMDDDFCGSLLPIGSPAKV